MLTVPRAAPTRFPSDPRLRGRCRRPGQTTLGTPPRRRQSVFVGVSGPGTGSGTGSGAGGCGSGGTGTSRLARNIMSPECERPCQCRSRLVRQPSPHRRRHAHSASQPSSHRRPPRSLYCAGEWPPPFSLTQNAALSFAAPSGSPVVVFRLARRFRPPSDTHLPEPVTEPEARRV